LNGSREVERHLVEVWFPMLFLGLAYSVTKWHRFRLTFGYDQVSEAQSALPREPGAERDCSESSIAISIILRRLPSIVVGNSDPVCSIPLENVPSTRDLSPFVIPRISLS